jgi:hypothetical protein
MLENRKLSDGSYQLCAQVSNNSLQGYVSVETRREIKHKLAMTGIQICTDGTADLTTGSIDNINEGTHVLATGLW